jgi:hypothetical protein
LRDALASGPVDVRDLQAEARAAGLLKADQAISQCKSFRQAKDALGIQSHREGFGRDSKYKWELPRSAMDDPDPMDVPF